MTEIQITSQTDSVPNRALLRTGIRSLHITNIGSIGFGTYAPADHRFAYFLNKVTDEFGGIYSSSAGDTHAGEGPCNNAAPIDRTPRSDARAAVSHGRSPARGRGAELWREHFRSSGRRDTGRLRTFARVKSGRRQETQQRSIRDTQAQDGGNQTGTVWGI